MEKTELFDGIESQRSLRKSFGERAFGFYLGVRQISVGFWLRQLVGSI